MPPSLSFLSNRSATANAVSRRDALRIAVALLPHFVALGIMAATEYGLERRLAFLLAWTLLNCFWLALLRRPAVSAGISLAIVAVLVLLSELKFRVLLMTVNFLDLMVIDQDTIAFLFTIFPGLNWIVFAALGAGIPVFLVLWRFDSFRTPRMLSAAGAVASIAGLIGVSHAVPMEPYEAFYGNNHVSGFARSGIDAITDLITNGFMESDAVAADRLKSADLTCQPAHKLPHILLVHDESSFDIRRAPGVKVPPGYGAHFRSFDDKQRNFIVEGAGGPSWYTEYNVLAGLSARSFGRFAYFVTRIAAGRVERGLPHALRRCGYQTFSLYPAFGAFMSAGSFQKTVGFQNFYDATALGTSDVEPDQFYYDAAARMIERQRSKGPMFVYVYLAANHFPWDIR